MSTPPKDPHIYRIVHHENVQHILQHGLHSRQSGKAAADYVNIGNNDIISRRDTLKVHCHPGTVVNDYVPFYFGIRTPMLYNIHTGHSVSRVDQSKIVYLVCKCSSIWDKGLQYCFTDGNAADALTTFYSDPAEVKELDWRSIQSTDWRNNNADNDTDRLRKKHSEFLVYQTLPREFIEFFVVYDEQRKLELEKHIQNAGLQIPVHIDPKKQFYFY